MTVKCRVKSIHKCLNFNYLFIIVCVCGAITAAACGGDEQDSFFRSPDSEAIRMSLRTSVPLSYVASAAMAAVNGHAPPGTNISETCGTFPCAALVTVENFETELPFRLSDHEASAVAVGIWSTPTEAVLTVSFIEAPAGTQRYQVTKISTFPVIERHAGGYNIIIADVDINISADPSDRIDLTDDQIQAEYDRLQIDVSDDPEINISMDAWLIEVLNNDTPEILNDDVYVVNGGGQYLNTTQSTADAVQLGMAGTRISWQCDTNPTRGLAFMNEVQASSGDSPPPPVIASALFEFESECSGSIDVVLATGNWLFATGGSIPIDLNSN